MKKLFSTVGILFLVTAWIGCGGSPPSGRAANVSSPLSAGETVAQSAAADTQPPPPTAAQPTPPSAPPPVPASPPPAGPALPVGAQTISHIEDMQGWSSCDTCAGIGGKGPAANHSLSQWVKDPSTDGSSVHFWVGENADWAAALWWKQLGGKDWAHHFVYDLKFYTDNPHPWALEFDVNQSISGGNLYIFGTECDAGGSRTWRVWDTAGRHWVSTGIECSLTSNTWHHLIWEFERTPDNRAHFVALTFDGQRHVVDKYFRPKDPKGSGLDVAVQMDQDGKGGSYNLWVDEIKLSYW